MNEPATLSQQPNQNSIPPINPNTSTSSPTKQQAEIDKLLASVEKFRKTGFVEDSEVTFAKEQILPKLGYSLEQIDDLGPVGIMVKLQEEADKKRLGVNGINTNQVTDNRQSETKPNIPNGNENPVLSDAKPIIIPKERIETIASSGNFDELTKEVAHMTDKLSSDIDQEIKRQLEEKKSLEQAQEKVDHVLKEHEELSLPEVKQAEETTRPRIGLFNKPTEKESVPPIIHGSPYPIQPPDTSGPTNISTDPLTASVEFALNSLKEGDSIGSEWTLQKILTTSFGNKKSPFYELLNKAGAAWTLSPEEMRDVLRSNILSKNSTPVKEIKGENIAPLHELKEIETKAVVKPNIDSKESENHETKIELAVVKDQEDKDFLKSKVQTPEVKSGNKKEVEEEEKHAHSEKDQQKPEEKHFQQSSNFKPTFANPVQETKPIFEKKGQAVEENENLHETPNKTKFSQKQIDFLNKIHADQSLWNTFTSFNPELWENFHNLYEDGKLISIGIDAHPLFDKLSSNDFGNLIDIQKGDTASKLLAEAGYNLTWSNEDAEIFAVHIIANYKLLTDSAHKVEVSGLAATGLLSEKDVIDLTVGAKNGNNESMHKLEEALNFIPIGSKFKLIKPFQLDLLKKYFRR